MDSIKQLAALASPGTIIMSLSNAVPNGYLRMEGQGLSRADYPDLYNAIAASNENIIKNSKVYCY